MGAIFCDDHFGDGVTWCDVESRMSKDFYVPLLVEPVSVYQRRCCGDTSERDHPRIQPQAFVKWAQVVVWSLCAHIHLFEDWDAARIFVTFYINTFKEEKKVGLPIFFFTCFSIGTQHYHKIRWIWTERKNIYATKCQYLIRLEQVKFLLYTYCAIKGYAGYS